MLWVVRGFICCLLSLLISTSVHARRGERFSNVQHQLSVSRVDFGQVPIVEDVAINLESPGLSYAISFEDKRRDRKHFLQLSLFSNRTTITGGESKTSFFFTDDDSVIKVTRVELQGIGFYYSPKPNAGWIYGAGLETWGIRFQTQGEGQRRARYTYPFMDGGYRWIGKQIPVSFSIQAAIPPMLRMSYGYRF